MRRETSSPPPSNFVPTTDPFPSRGLQLTHTIASIRAAEILDSRGNPTVRVFLMTTDGQVSVASVPSGASTGAFEAHELRDGDPKRYGGKGVLKAVANVNEVIAKELHGADPRQQEHIDELLIELDGTVDKSNLGANAILGVSMAAARAGARIAARPLYDYLGGENAVLLPVPMMNVINGGGHAQNSLDFQEFMVVPHGAPNFAEALRYGAETFHALRGILSKRGYSTGVGDEGGFAPNLKSNEEACDLIVEAILAAGYRPGRDISIALDPAASAFWTEKGYDLKKSGQGVKSADEMTDLYSRWVAKYPIVSLEDGLGEKDWAGFPAHTAALGKKVQIVGDDLYVTNTEFIGRGIKEKSTNSVLIKLNQIGTVTETIKAIELCRKAGWTYVVSHRSGETEDPFIADFTVAMGGGQIKTGSLCRSERIAKYNRLLEIETELGKRAEFADPFGSMPGGR